MTREQIMTALFGVLTGPPCIVVFTADTTSGSAALANVSSTASLQIGMPVSGPGIPAGATIAALSPVTLSFHATAAATGVALTQGFLTTGRRLKMWSAVAAQPALFLDDRGTEYPGHPTGLPPKRLLMADAWIYSNAGKNPDAVPATALNALLDAIEAALAPSPVTNTQTLGGLVTHCWIEGKPEYYSGHLDGQAIAMVPISMLVP